MSQITQELYSLIQTMSLTEKRNFIMQCNHKKRGSNSLALFEALDKLEKYDTDALTEYLRENKNNKLSNNLPSETTLLFRLILKIYNYTTEAMSMEDKLKNDLKDAKFLYNRGCTFKARRMLNKLKKEAETFDKKKILLEVYEFERLTQRFSTKYNYSEYIEEINKKEIELVEAIALEQKLRHIFDKVFRLVLKFGMLKKGAKNKGIAEIEIALSKVNREQCQCFGTQFFYLSSMEFLHRLKSDIDAAFRHSTEIYQLYEKHKATKENANTNYIVFLSNYLNYLILLNKPKDQVLTIIAEVKNIKLHSPKEEMNRFSNIAYSEFCYYLNQGDFEKMENMLPELLEGLEKYENKMELGRKIVLWYNVMLYYFFKEDFHLIHDWIEKILDHGNKSRRIDTWNKGKLFQLVVHYELGHTGQFLESSIKKVKRGYSEFDNSNELVDLIAKTIGSYARNPLKKINFEALLEQFNKIDKTKNKNLPYDEIEIWIKSKIGGLTMQKIAEQMLQNKSVE